MNGRSANDERASKTLSWLLRHGAQKEGIAIAADGYVRVPAILQHPRYARHYTLSQLQSIVANDKKQRYALRLNATTGEYEIRANQGHSMATVQSEQCLTAISMASEVTMAVHGTYYRHWESIRRQGLRRMGRNHVHFAIADIPIGRQQHQQQQKHNKEAISGFRGDCEILIYLDVAKALHDGMPLFRSENNVVLCAGLAHGEIPKEYFAKVIDRRTGEALSF